MTYTARLLQEQMLILLQRQNKGVMQHGVVSGLTFVLPGNETNVNSVIL